MNNNDILRRLRYALSLKDSKSLEIFKLADYDMDRELLLNLLKKEEEEGFVECSDNDLTAFLDGLITLKRGKQEGAPPPKKIRLTNNVILRKLKIAFSFQDTHMITIMKLTGFNVSKTELNALFRKPDHRNYKPCGDQFLRNFITGLAKLSQS